MAKWFELSSDEHIQQYINRRMPEDKLDGYNQYREFWKRQNQEALALYNSMRSTGHHEMAESMRSDYEEILRNYERGLAEKDDPDVGELAVYLDMRQLCRMLRDA